MLYKDSYRDKKAKILIEDCGEVMVEIPAVFPRFSPHPYQILDAPYDDKSPFFIREDVLKLLGIAQKNLSLFKPGYKIKIFDAYRPIGVQKFMIEYDTQRVSQEIYQSTFDDLDNEKQLKVERKISHFWSPISEDIALNPPPHSTGSALDLTIVDESENELEMGTKIDELTEASASDYFDGEVDTNIYKINRKLLKDIMSEAGFTQLPTEWWHFSYGDQIWAVDKSVDNAEPLKAKYGMI